MENRTQGTFADKPQRNTRTAGYHNPNTANMLLVNLIAIAAILLASAATLSVALAV